METNEINVTTENKNEKSLKKPNVSVWDDDFKRGLIWSGIIALVVATVFFGIYFSSPSSELLIGAIILTVTSFTFSTQLFWGGHLLEVFLFFCRSFTWPFGFIAEFSLDGILWLITVKLLCWIIGGILSILFFLLGLVFCLVYSVISFPFSLIANIRG